MALRTKLRKCFAVSTLDKRSSNPAKHVAWKVRQVGALSLAPQLTHHAVLGLAVPSLQYVARGSRVVQPVRVAADDEAAPVVPAHAHVHTKRLHLLVETVRVVPELTFGLEGALEESVLMAFLRCVAILCCDCGWLPMKTSATNELCIRMCFLRSVMNGTDVQLLFHALSASPDHRLECPQRPRLA